MDILLISSIDVLWPESEYVPYLGLMVLRDILKEDYEVEYVDFKLLDEVVEALPALSNDEAMEYLARYIVGKKPKVVGFYTFCSTFVFAVQIAAHVRDMEANIKIVFGGPHASVCAEGCLEAFPFLDVVCVGESELSVKPLMDALIYGGDLELVNGVAYRTDCKVGTNCKINADGASSTDGAGNASISDVTGGTDGAIRINSPAELIDEEELSAYTVFDYTPFTPEQIKTAYLEGGRGCPFKCTFCTTSTFWGRKFRLKPIDALLAEMDKLYGLYGIKNFAILHDHFTLDRNRIAGFCHSLIESGRDYGWSCSARLDSLDDDLLCLLKESGCHSIYLGIETGSGRMQRIIKKNLRLSDALEIFRQIHELGIAAMVSFIFGFPEEMEEDFLDTLSMIESVFLIGFRSFQLHPYNALPQTEETRKIIDRLYFDRNAAIDHLFFNKNLFSDKSIRLIEQYPDLFAQHYTFDSNVGQKYQHINTLIHLMCFLSLYSRKSLERLIAAYGLQGLYLKYEGLFRDLREEVDRISAAERNNTEDLTLVFKTYDQILRNEEVELRELGFSELCKYERHMIEYAVAGTTKPVIHEFAVDMEELLSTGTCKEEQCNVVYLKRGSGIVVMKCSSLLNILNL